MAKLILKVPYYKPGHRTESGKSRGGYAEYIATREGVEILRGGMLGYIGERQGSNGLFHTNRAVGFGHLTDRIMAYFGEIIFIITATILIKSDLCKDGKVNGNLEKISIDSFLAVTDFCADNRFKRRC